MYLDSPGSRHLADPHGGSLAAIEERRYYISCGGHLDEENPGFVSIVAMVELAWVLARSYGVADQGLATIIEHLLEAPVLVVENEVEVFTALTALKRGHGDFADVVLGELGRRAGCSVTFTFDGNAARLPGFALA